MDVGVLGSKPLNCADCSRQENLENDQVLVNRKTLQAVLEKCQRALELINTTNCLDEDDEKRVDSEAVDDDQRCGDSRPLREQLEVDEICNLLKSKFLVKTEGAQASLPHHITEEDSSWDVVSEVDIWESGNVGVDEEDFVIVEQEGIVEGIACIMAAYLLSLKEAKELTPCQLQEALSKTFSLKRKKGKLQKAWDGSKVIYNVASWGHRHRDISKSCNYENCYKGFLDIVPGDIKASLMRGICQVKISLQGSD